MRCQVARCCTSSYKVLTCNAVANTVMLASLVVTLQTSVYSFKKKKRKKEKILLQDSTFPSGSDLKNSVCQSLPQNLGIDMMFSAADKQPQISKLGAQQLRLRAAEGIEAFAWPQVVDRINRSQ